MVHIPLRAAIIGVTFFLAACAGEPYVFEAGEFDRDSPNFAKELTDRADVQICYNSRSTTPAALLSMAARECGRFGKRARFTRQELLECPLLTPSRAHFVCENP